MTHRRIKWHRADFQLPIDELYRVFKTNIFSNSTRKGFSELYFEDGVVSGLYSEEKQFNEEILSPVGDSIEHIWVDYESIRFSIQQLDKTYLLISIINPRKSFKFFINYLSSLFEYKYSFQALQLNLNNYIDWIRVQDEIEGIRFKKARISGLVVNRSAKAAVEITSLANALSDLRDLVVQKQYTLDKVVGAFHHRGEPVTYELTRTGGLLCSEEHEKIFISFLKDSQIQT
ncbi:hypothetical protein [Pseudoalteromonas sp. bablab_jr010]|uniref:hypothetical protein n=1 Tax=Pseudoalteromonas sp. bablab_jr010 TaxID=2755063 RepID=UPI0018F727FC|nr:hypothetical protein [Pseudoalteromonas sp. bablab_jr010]